MLLKCFLSEKHSGEIVLLPFCHFRNWDTDEQSDSADISQKDGVKMKSASRLIVDVGEMIKLSS